MTSHYLSAITILRGSSFSSDFSSTVQLMYELHGCINICVVAVIRTAVSEQVFRAKIVVAQL